MGIRKTDFCDSSCIDSHSKECVTRRNTAKATRWRQKNPEYYSGYVNTYIKNHRKKVNVGVRSRRASNPVFRLANTMRSELSKAVRNIYQPSWLERKLGCSLVEFKQHIERQFLPGMTWDNRGHGKDKWTFDHIIPFSTATTKEEVYKLFHFSNTRPLWFKDNLKKGRKRDGEKSYQVKKFGGYNEN